MSSNIVGNKTVGMCTTGTDPIIIGGCVVTGNVIGERHGFTHGLNVGLVGVRAPKIFMVSSQSRGRGLMSTSNSLRCMQGEHNLGRISALVS